MVDDTLAGGSARKFPLRSRTFASAIAIAQDASRVAVASGGRISVVQADLPYEKYGDAAQEGGLITDPLPGVGTTITGLVFVGAHERLVSASQRILAMWDLRQQARIAQQVGPNLPDLVEASTRPGLAVSPRDGTVAWVDNEGKLTLRNPRTGQISVAIHDSTVARRLYFTPDGKLLTVGRKGIGVWEVNSQLVRQIASWPYPSDVQTSFGVPFAVPTADGSRFVIVGDDGSVSTLTTSDGLTKTLVKGGEDDSFRDEVVLRPDGAELLVIQADGGTHLVDLQTGQARPGPAFGLSISSAAYSLDGRRLAVTDGRTSLLVWDTEASQVVRRTAAERVDQITFSPRGDRLLTMTGDGRISVWDIASGLRLGDLQVRQFEALDARDVGYQTQLEWDPSGSVLWTATMGIVLRWDLDPQAWIRNACAAAGRSLTADDWQNAGGLIPDDLSCGP